MTATSGAAHRFAEYFADAPFVDRYAVDPDDAVDVIIPVLHTNELWRANLQSIYREIPVRRLLLSDGGCIDDTMVVASAFPRVVALDHRRFVSLGYCLRALIEAVETDWFVYLHSDVYLRPGWFDAMRAARAEHDWYECAQNTLILARYREPTLQYARSYSGGQMGRTDALRDAVSSIDDDFLYRNEDVIIARLVEAAGHRYGKVAGAEIDHEVMIKESPAKRRVRRVNFDLELGREEEIRAAMTYAKGIVKYLSPDQGQDLIPGVNENVHRLETLGALRPGEFRDWVLATRPEWIDWLVLSITPVEAPLQGAVGALWDPPGAESVIVPLETAAAAEPAQPMLPACATPPSSRLAARIGAAGLRGLAVVWIVGIVFFYWLAAVPAAALQLDAWFDLALLDLRARTVGQLEAPLFSP